MKKNSFNYGELINCANGELFGPGNARLPSPPMLMFDRITEIRENNGEFKKGIIKAELDIKDGLWFFNCHFKEDPVMPGCLGLDAMWQLVGFYLGWLGNPCRGRALGVTMFLPEEDRYSNSRQRINSMIAALFGGRVAEEEIFGEEAVTTGASNDIERATALARSMVTKWGLSDKMGPLAYAEEENEVFLGKTSGQQQKSVSNETARTIDTEIRKIIDTQYSRATKLIKDNMDKMHLMADALMKYETIDTGQIDEIMDGKIPSAPESWSDDDDSSNTSGGVTSNTKENPATNPAS